MKRKVIIRLEVDSKQVQTNQIARRILKNAWSLRRKYKVNTIELQDSNQEWQTFTIGDKK